jgi:hypothetical protein
VGRVGSQLRLYGGGGVIPPWRARERRSHRARRQVLGRQLEKQLLRVPVEEGCEVWCPVGLRSAIDSAQGSASAGQGAPASTSKRAKAYSCSRALRWYLFLPSTLAGRQGRARAMSASRAQACIAAAHIGRLGTHMLSGSTERLAPGTDDGRRTKDESEMAASRPKRTVTASESVLFARWRVEYMALELVCGASELESSPACRVELSC